MSDSIKDIEKFVRESAKKKKDKEEKKKVSEVNSSIQTAISQRKELEKEIKKKKKNYTFIILCILGTTLYAFLIFLTYSYYGTSSKKAWIRTEVKPEDFTRVKVFASKLLVEGAAKKNLEDLFNSRIPVPWKKSELKILASIPKGMEVEDISLDKKTVGKKALFNVKCSTASGKRILIYVLSEGGGESVFKIDAADFNTMKEKNEKDIGNANDSAK